MNPNTAKIMDAAAKATERAFAADKQHAAACAAGLTFGDPAFDAAQAELDAAGAEWDAARDALAAVVDANRKTRAE